jgi:hypothetical protein
MASTTSSEADLMHIVAMKIHHPPPLQIFDVNPHRSATHRDGVDKD